MLEIATVSMNSTNQLFVQDGCQGQLWISTFAYSD